MSHQTPLLLPLFVYGTLLPGEANYARFLAGRTLSEQPASTRGSLWLVDSEGYPYLLPGAETVHGLLMVLVPRLYAATLAAIDRLEDYDPRFPATSLYLRRTASIRLREGQDTTAWCYFWNAGERPGRHLPGGDFRRR